MWPVVSHHPMSTIKIHGVSWTSFRGAMWLRHIIRMVLMLCVRMTRLLMRMMAVWTRMCMGLASLMRFGNIKLSGQQ